MSANLQALRTKRAELITKMDDLANPMDDAGAARGWTDADQVAFDAVDTELKALDEQIVRAERVEAAKTKARLVPADRSTVEPTPREVKEKGTDFARIVRSMVAEKGNSRNAAAWAAEQPWDNKDEIAKALGSGTASGGGYLVPVQYSNDVIELLRSRAVVMASQPTIVPLSGTMEIPRIASGVSGGYIGENDNAPKQEPTFGNIKLTEKKLAALVPISNDLIRLSSPQVDGLVRDDMVAGLATTMDRAFLRGVGTEFSPKGMRYFAGNVSATAGTTATNVETDIASLNQALLGADVRMLRPAWFMAPRTWSHLYKLRDANGVLIFPEIRDRSAPGGNGWLYGYPVYVTTSIPTNLGGGTETEIYFADMADFVVGDGRGIEISVSDTAAYHDGTSVQAAFSKDQTVVKALMRHDTAARHEQSIAVKTGIVWGV